MKTCRMVYIWSAISLMLICALSASADENSSFGLNEGIGRIPDRLQRGQSQAQMIETFEEQARKATEIGIKWHRKHCCGVPTSFAYNVLKAVNFDFTLHDAYIRAIQQYDIQSIITLAPYWQCNPILYSNIPPGSTYFPEDEEDFRDYVRRVVERYDGDGYEDMPGLQYPVKYWMLDNEVDGKANATIGRDRQKVEWITPETYVRLLSVVREEIQQADPEAKLLASFLTITRYQIPRHKEYFKKFIALGGEQYVDIIDFHDYNYKLDLLKKSIKLVQSLLKQDTPLWIVETSVQSDPEANPDYDLQTHAQSVVKYHVTALAMGIEKVFWHTLQDGPKISEGDMARKWKSFGTNGYYGCKYWDTSGRASVCRETYTKPGGYTHELMVEKLDGFQTVTTLKDGVYQFNFPDAPPVVVAWSKKEKTLDVSEIFGETQVTVTHILEERDVAQPVVENAESRRITISASPVFIEPR